MNTLYYGDNLKILREYVKDETVDLIYIDPPFNSIRNYNVLFSYYLIFFKLPSPLISRDSMRATRSA